MHDDGGCNNKASLSHAEWLLGEGGLSSHDAWLLTSLTAELDAYFGYFGAAEAQQAPVTEDEVHTWQEASDRCALSLKCAQGKHLPYDGWTLPSRAQQSSDPLQQHRQSDHTQVLTLIRSLD